MKRFLNNVIQTGVASGLCLAIVNCSSDKNTGAPTSVANSSKPSVSKPTVSTQSIATQLNKGSRSLLAAEVEQFVYGSNVRTITAQSLSSNRYRFSLNDQGVKTDFEAYESHSAMATDDSDVKKAEKMARDEVVAAKKHLDGAVKEAQEDLDEEIRDASGDDVYDELANNQKKLVGPQKRFDKAKADAQMIIDGRTMVVPRNHFLIPTNTPTFKLEGNGDYMQKKSDLETAQADAKKRLEKQVAEEKADMQEELDDGIEDVYAAIQKGAKWVDAANEKVADKEVAAIKKYMETQSENGDNPYLYRKKKQLRDISLGLGLDIKNTAERELGQKILLFMINQPVKSKKFYTSGYGFLRNMETKVARLNKAEFGVWSQIKASLTLGFGEGAQDAKALREEGLQMDIDRNLDFRDLGNVNAKLAFVHKIITQVADKHGGSLESVSGHEIQAALRAAIPTVNKLTQKEIDAYEKAKADAAAKAAAAEARYKSFQETQRKNAEGRAATLKANAAKAKAEAEAKKKATEASSPSSKAQGARFDIPRPPLF